MNISSAHLDHEGRFPIAKHDGRGFRSFDAARDELVIGIRGDWVVLSERREGGRAILIHGSRFEYLALSPEAAAALLQEPGDEPPSAESPPAAPAPAPAPAAASRRR